jgi:hypothetical protein
LSGGFREIGFLAPWGSFDSAFEESSGGSSGHEVHRWLVRVFLLQLKGQGLLLLLWVKMGYTLREGVIVLRRAFFSEVGQTWTWKGTVHFLSNNYNRKLKIIYYLIDCVTLFLNK